MTGKSNAFGIASFVLSILGILFLIMPYFAIIFSILAIIFAVKQKKVSQTGLSAAGFVIGIIATILNTIILLIILLALLIGLSA